MQTSQSHPPWGIRGISPYWHGKHCLPQPCWCSLFPRTTSTWPGEVCGILPRGLWTYVTNKLLSIWSIQFWLSLWPRGRNPCLADGWIGGGKTQASGVFPLNTPHVCTFLSIPTVKVTPWLPNWAHCSCLMPPTPPYTTPKTKPEHIIPLLEPQWRLPTALRAEAKWLSWTSIASSRLSLGFPFLPLLLRPGYLALDLCFLSWPLGLFAFRHEGLFVVKALSFSA